MIQMCAKMTVKALKQMHSTEVFIELRVDIYWMTVEKYLWLLGDNRADRVRRGGGGVLIVRVCFLMCVFSEDLIRLMCSVSHLHPYNSLQ